MPVACIGPTGGWCSSVTSVTPMSMMDEDDDQAQAMAEAMTSAMLDEADRHTQAMTEIMRKAGMPLAEEDESS